MMQETVLRVFVVALGLLLCPRDPGVEESDHIVAPNSHNPEERLPREREKLDQATPLSDKMTPDGNEGPHDDINIPPEQQSQSDQHSTETIVTKEPRERADHKLPKKSANESDANPQEHNSDLKTKQNGKDVLNNSSTKEPGNLQERDKKTEQMEERKSPFPHVQNKAAETETEEAALADWERDYLWYIWNTFSIISMMRFFGKYLKRHFQMNQEVTGTFPAGCRVAEVLLPDVATLHYFYDKCVQISSEKKGRDGEFLEGFANDLLDAMRNISDDNGSMVIEDFQVGNASDIMVHVTPPDLYGFQCQLVNNQVSDLLLDMQVCGQIKLVEERIQNGCPCQSSEAEDDMVCLLHCESKKVKTKMGDVCVGLCSKNTPFLSKGKVARWFQRTIKQAWAQISHKYEFELHIPYIEAPGALVIRFRSGKMICFNMIPVIKFNAEAHFFITPWSSNNLDIFWTLSLTNYEDHLLEYLSKRLPKNSCHDQTLEIACFLHKRQSVLSGSTALKDYHFKMALMHLLLTKKPSQWNSNLLACRLQDLLEFMEKSLEKKLLTHVLIGNPLAKVIDLPTELTKTKPVNLFHPFVVHNCIYKNAVTHFQEMLRNADMLIHDYVAQHTNNANSSV